MYVNDCQCQPRIINPRLINVNYHNVGAPAQW